MMSFCIMTWLALQDLLHPTCLWTCNIWFTAINWWGVVIYKLGYCIQELHAFYLLIFVLVKKNGLGCCEGAQVFIFLNFRTSGFEPRRMKYVPITVDVRTWKSLLYLVHMFIQHDHISKYIIIPYNYTFIFTTICFSFFSKIDSKRRIFEPVVLKFL